MCACILYFLCDYVGRPTKNCHQLDKFFRSPAGIGHVTKIEYKRLLLHTVPARPDMDNAFVVSTARGVEGFTHQSQNP